MKPSQIINELLEGKDWARRLIGEASTWYLYRYQATIRNIRAIYGDNAAEVRLIILLRNPVERAWSHYQLKLRNEEEWLPFDRAIDPGIISGASACIIAEGFEVPDAPEGMSLLICSDPELAFIEAIKRLHPERTYTPSIAAEAVIASDVALGKDIFIGPYAVIGEQTTIGDRSEILAGAYLGNNVKIDKNCRIHPYAVIYDGVEIGDFVTVHAGAIVGADGFGYKFRNGAHVKVPQIGNVRIEDHVEIGANTCIDRGALGSTEIGLGSKIDNLGQIGHNNKIGKHVIMCGHTGVSGSCICKYIQGSEDIRYGTIHH